MLPQLDFSQPTDRQSIGMLPKGLEHLAQLFDRQIAEGLHPAAQMVVVRRGQVVFDRVGGTARGKPVSPTTPFLTFSCSKALTAMCIHKLIESGQIEMDAPVAEYWPQFGKNGKAGITIRQVFMHQAAIPGRDIRRQIILWPFWSLVTRSIANLSPDSEPGTQVEYHLVNAGFIFGEVVRRVTGIPIERYMAETFLQPLGMSHSWLQIPKKALKSSPRIYSGADDTDQALITRVFNTASYRRAVNPAVSLHSTARDLAVFYQMLLNGGEYGGKRYLEPETIKLATAQCYEGEDTFLETNVRRAMGFHLGGHREGAEMPSPTMGEKSTPRTFGHFGNASCMAWADPDAELVVTFTCNRFLDSAGSRQRWKDLNDAVWEALK